MIPQFISLSPKLGSALTARNLLGILSPSLSLCPSPTFSLSLSLSLKVNKETVDEIHRLQNWSPSGELDSMSIWSCAWVRDSLTGPQIQGVGLWQVLPSWAGWVVARRAAAGSLGS